MTDTPKFDTQPILDALMDPDPAWKLPPLVPALIVAKNDAHYTLAKGRYALRPVNSGVMKATESDRTIEMEGRTADVRRNYDNLNDLLMLCMAVIGR